MSAPWMPFYVADYLSDTRRLTTLEHGAYLLLIMEYWRHGSLPDDDAELAQITLLGEKEWMRVRPKIARFFRDGWKHKRIDEELEKSEKKSAARSEAGRRGGNARALKYNDADLANAEYGQKQSHTDVQASSSDSQPYIESSLRSDSARAEPDDLITGLDRVQDPPKRKAKPLGSRKSKGRTKIEPDAQPTESDFASAESAGMDRQEFRDQWRQFRDYHLSRGSLMDNWAAAWRTWIGNWKRYRERDSQRSVSPSRRPLTGAMAIFADAQNDLLNQKDEYHEYGSSNVLEYRGNGR